MRGARARASERVMLSNAAFEAQYAILLPLASRAASDEMLTITPPGSASSSRRTARMVAKGPRTLVRMM